MAGRRRFEECMRVLYIDSGPPSRYSLYMSDIHKSGAVLSVDLGSTMPVVQQIANGLRRSLLDGALAPGDTLPSSRALARDLGVHFNTVAQAYRELEAEGWLELKRRSGTVVIERRTPRLDAGVETALIDRFLADLEAMVTELEARGLKRAELNRAAKRLLSGSATSDNAHETTGDRP